MPNFDWILEKRAWWDICYEHCNYFRASDFTRFFDEVVEIGTLFAGQYLYVIANLMSIRRKISAAPPTKFPSDFDATLKKDWSPGYVAGAATKGVLFSLRLQRSGYQMLAALDINKQKQGQYLPGSGLKVFKYEDALKSLESVLPVYIMNSNYAHEIQAATKNQFNYVYID